MTANEIKFNEIRDMYLVAYYHATGRDYTENITYSKGWVSIGAVKCRLSKFEEMLNALLLKFKAYPNLH